MNLYPRLRWLEQVLNERYGHAISLSINSKSILKFNLNGDQRYITFPIDQFTFIRTDSNLPCAHWNAAAEGWTPILDAILPAPGILSLPYPLVRATNYGMHVAYDILGLIYWMLSRQEEVGRLDLDQHGRFPATSSHAYKYGYLERPVVDEWLHILGQVIKRTWPGIDLRQHNFCMKVSHDVDVPSRYAFGSRLSVFRRIVGDILKRRDLAAALLGLRIRLGSGDGLNPADPCNTFDWIMDVSERHGLVSAFYFICGHSSPQFDGDYEPDHPAITTLMRRIYQRGHEIGLHPSYNSYQNPSAIYTEAKRLRIIAQSEGIEQIEWGGRMHYLRWEHPTTLRALSLARMDYDSTLAYADLPGFRSGTCHEYPAFDPVAQEILKIRIRPLVAMECTVIEPRYMSLGIGDEAFAKFKKLKEACRAVNGCFTLLWHNSELQSIEERQLYEAVLAE